MKLTKFLIAIAAAAGIAGAWYFVQSGRPPVSPEKAAVEAQAPQQKPQAVPQPAPAEAQKPAGAKPVEEAALPANAQAAVDGFLAAQQQGGESTQPQGSAAADLDGDGREEIALVWTALGPTYWSNTLTVFTQGAEGYEPAASLALKGEAKLAGVQDGLITLDEVNYAEGDPACCPTLKGTWAYKWQGKEITRLEKTE